MSGRARPLTLFGVLAVILGVLSAVSLLVGEVDASPGDVWRAVLARLGGAESRFEALVWSLRIPRLLAGIAIGIGLAGAGAVLNRVHRNPMADPYVLGVSAAAGLCTALALLLGAGTVVGIAAGATGGALYAAATGGLSSARPDPARLLVVGLTLGLGLLAWTVIIVFIADTPRLPTFTYFIFGSLGTAGPTGVWASSVVVWPALGWALAGWRSLDLLALGDAEAHHLGVDVRRTRRSMLVAAGTMTGATVGLGGVIGFVGLMGPWLVRRWAGPSTIRALPAAVLAGAALVVGADIVARAVAGPVEVPIGIVTAALGGPLLVWLLTREAAR